MAGVASDCDSIAFYDTLQASEAVHAHANQLPEPPPHVATALLHVPDSGGVTRATEPAAVSAATAISRPPECDRPLSLGLGTRLPARAAIASSHAPLPLPVLFPSLGAATLASLSHPATATAATRPLSPSADMQVEGNAARSTWDKGVPASFCRVASPLPAPASPRAASGAAPAGGVVTAPDGETQEASRLPASLLALLPPPPSVEAAAGDVAPCDAPAEGVQEQRADGNDEVEGGAGGDASDASRTEAEDEEAGEQEQVPTQAMVREVAAPGFVSFAASEAPRDDDVDSEGGCAPPAAQVDYSMHLSGERASTSSDDDARGGGSGSESESERGSESDGGSGSDGGDEDGGDGNDAAEDAAAGQGARVCGGDNSAPQLPAGGEGGALPSKNDGTPQPQPSHATSRALDVLAAATPPELELQLTAAGGGAPSIIDAAAAAAAASPLPPAVEELWPPSRGCGLRRAAASARSCPLVCAPSRAPTCAPR